MNNSEQVQVYLQFLCIEAYIFNKNKRRGIDMKGYTAKYISACIRTIKYSIITQYCLSRDIQYKNRKLAYFQFHQLSNNKIERIATNSRYFFVYMQKAVNQGLCLCMP